MPSPLRTFRNRTGNKPESSRPNKHAEFAAREFLEVYNFIARSESIHGAKRSFCCIIWTKPPSIRAV
jgi:hypothetical protein